MAEENLADMFNAHNAPMARTLGIEMTLVTKDRIEGEMTAREEFATLPKNLHGGAIMAFADNLGGCGAFVNMPQGAMTSTVESKTNFLRGIPIGDRVKGVTTPVHIGRTLQVWKTELFRADGKLSAVVTQTQIIKTS